MRTIEIRRYPKKVWMLGSLLLVPLFALLGGLILLLVQQLETTPEQAYHLPINLVILAVLGVLALPVLVAWAIAKAIARRGKPDLVIDTRGVHHTRLPMSIYWKNLVGVDVSSSIIGRRIRLRVRDLEEVIQSIPRAWRDAVRRTSGRGVELPSLFFYRESPEEIAKAIREAWGNASESSGD